MIEHVASASSSALASSGQERISYRSVKNGAVTSAGTDTVSYSGTDYNYTVRTAVPVFPVSVIRVVNGQFYLALPTASGRRGSTNLARAPSASFPEAATLLRLLSPAAKFQNAGTEVIGGVRLTRLHATQVSGLPDVPTLARYANLVSAAKSAVVPPGTLTALDLWADGHGVVHQMTILSARRRRADDAHGDVQRLRTAAVHHRPRDLDCGPGFLLSDTRCPPGIQALTALVEFHSTPRLRRSGYSSMTALYSSSAARQPAFAWQPD